MATVTDKALGEAFVEVKEMAARLLAAGFDADQVNTAIQAALPVLNENFHLRRYFARHERRVRTQAQVTEARANG